MATDSYEFAVFGSTPLAGLIAGLLATQHGKRVCMVAEASSAFRLPRGADLSVAPITRPESWALLKHSTAETLKLLMRIHARTAVRKIDPIFIGGTAESADALQHVRHVARGFDYAGEWVPNIPNALRLREAVLVDRSRIEPMLANWLEKSGVGLLGAGDVNATIRRDGSAVIDFAGHALEAAHAVLADDAAIISHLEVADRDRTLQVVGATAVLTEPARPLPSRLVVHIDRGVVLMQGRNRSIVAIGTGRPDEAAVRIGECLAGHGPLRRAGQRIFRTINTVDGAPLVGPARGIRATVLAGLGISGMFLAPAIARLLTGSASEAEKAYFAAREAGRGNARALVADFSPNALEATP